MLGNAWQLTSDCWNANYDGAPSDGSARTTGFCDLRVGRRRKLLKPRVL
jgi:formylglycine-generating enzyme required for sulfatase activity